MLEKIDRPIRYSLKIPLWIKDELILQTNIYIINYNIIIYIIIYNIIKYYILFTIIYYYGLYY